MQNVRNLRLSAGGLARGCVAAMSAAALLYVIGCAPSTPAAQTSLTRFRVGDMGQLRVPGQLDAPNPKMPGVAPVAMPAASPAPDMAITGPDGNPLKLADFKGKVTVVNLWATWCAPCKEEMPTLAALQTTYADKPFALLAVNSDVAEDVDKAKAQIAASAPLKFYHVNGLDLAFAFKPASSDFPTTLIYDKAGVERARLSGPADWNGKNARALIDALLAEG